MQILKRLGSIFMVVILLLTMSVSAFAAGAPVGSITIKDSENNVKQNSSYSAYKIVEWNMSVLNGEIVYTDMQLNAAYKTAIVDTLGTPLTQLSGDDEILKAVSALSNANDISDLAVALSQVNRVADYTASQGVFSAIPYGYYLIIETENNAGDGTVLSKPILVSVPDKATGDPNVSVSVKTSKATVEKSIVKTLGESTAEVKTAENKIGDIVNFKLTSTIPTYASNATDISYYITDTLSKGLTLDKTSVVVSSINGVMLADGNYTVTNTADNGNTVLKIDFVYANIKNLEGLTVTYNAILNKEARVGAIGNPNSVTLTYSNKPGTGGTGSIYTTPPKHTIVYTTGIQLTKIDSDNVQLSGATFGIYSDSACKNPVGFYTYVVTTDATGTHVINQLTEGNSTDNVITVDDGIAYFGGLIAGDYYIKEINAPSGYDLLKDPIKVTIGVTLPTAVILGDEEAIWSTTGTNFSVTNGIFYGEVLNTKGFRLPATGGMGTIIFTVSGIALLTLAGAMFLIYYKKKNHA